MYALSLELTEVAVIFGIEVAFGWTSLVFGRLQFFVELGESKEPFGGEGVGSLRGGV